MEVQYLDLRDIPGKCEGQGIWKTNEDGYLMAVHGYGICRIPKKEGDKLVVNDELYYNKYVHLVADDIFKKLSLLRGESVFDSRGVFNYDRFFDRFAIKAGLSLAMDYTRVGDFSRSEWVKYVDDLYYSVKSEIPYYEDFFGKGEFPFIEFGVVKRTDGDYYFMYFLKR